jgi:tetratricopeptide (TPR) repeat protein
MFTPGRSRPECGQLPRFWFLLAYNVRNLTMRPIAVIRAVQNAWHNFRFRSSNARQYVLFHLWNSGAWLLWQARACLWAFHFGAILSIIPALAGIAAIASLLAFTLLAPPEKLRQHYNAEAWNAFAVKDFKTALTCFRRLAQLQQQKPENLYGLALTHDALGETEFASFLMNELAPEDELGYAPAQLWLAGKDLTSPDRSARTRSRAQKHLRNALAGHVKDPEKVHGLLGQLYLAEHRIDDAEEHLALAVPSIPELRLAFARTLALKGRTERAQALAKEALEFHQAAAKADDRNIAARVAWAEAAAFLEDFPAAKRILEEGLVATNSPVYRLALAKIYLVWFDHVSRTANTDLGTRLAMLESGLRCDPNDPALLERLLAITKMPSVEGDHTVADLQKLLVRGEMPATIHFVLGVDAWRRNRTDEARVHWERANQLDPNSPSIANNLAVVLAGSNSPDLTQALRLVNMAIDRLPNEPSYRDTRGTILAKMGKWNEALPDLEAALSKNSQSPQLHKLLADTYEHLGMAAMAAEHRRLETANP